MDTKTLFEIQFARINLQSLIEELINVIKDNRRVRLHTANVDHIVLGFKNERFKDLMRKSDILVADGMPIVWYSKIFKKKLPDRVTGVDISYKLCELSYKLNFKLFFLGGQKGIGEQAKKNMEKKYPGVQIVGVYSPDNEEIMDKNKSKKIVNIINDSGANVLLVSFGTPKQEYWLEENMNLLNSNVNIGVGATLDFMAGRVKRAPKFMGKLGLEWVFRLFLEPKRMFKRYILKDSLFLIILILDIYTFSKIKLFHNKL